MGQLFCRASKTFFFSLNTHTHFFKMGCCGAKQSEEGKSSFRGGVSAVLLGLSGSGKSTIRKQLQVCQNKTICYTKQDLVCFVMTDFSVRTFQKNRFLLLGRISFVFSNTISRKRRFFSLFSLIGLEGFSFETLTFYQRNF
jgi:energy-coupling factor transporter ATP-binding protein EcfA2